MLLLAFEIIIIIIIFYNPVVETNFHTNVIFVENGNGHAELIIFDLASQLAVVSFSSENKKEILFIPPLPRHV